MDTLRHTQEGMQDGDTQSPGAALITGGTTGIGLATARVLHQQGFAVLVTGRNPDTIAAAERALPGDLVVLRADARVLADAARVADEIRALPSTLSVVFLKAGIHRMLPIEAVDEATFDDLFAVNVKGQFFTLQKVLPLLGEGGSVVFNGALGASKGLSNWSVVSATKGALMALVPSLAIELSARRIRVNAVIPGLIRTPSSTSSGPNPMRILRPKDFGSTDEHDKRTKGMTTRRGRLAIR